MVLIIVATCTTNAPETKVVEKLYDYDAEARIKELGIALAVPGKPVANHVNSVRTDNLVFMAGKGQNKGDGTITGKVGETYIEEGYEAAKLTAIQQLSTLKDFPGTILFTSHDHKFVNTMANRIGDLRPDGYTGKLMTYDAYAEWKSEQEMAIA